MLVSDPDFSAGYYDMKIFDTTVSRYRSVCYSNVLTTHPYIDSGDTVVEVDVADHGLMIGTAQTRFLHTGYGFTIVARIDVMTNRCPFTPERLAYAPNPDATQYTVATNENLAKIDIPTTSWNSFVSLS